jgi:hypothetical protein
MGFLVHHPIIIRARPVKFRLLRIEWSAGLQTGCRAGLPARTPLAAATPDLEVGASSPLNITYAVLNGPAGCSSGLAQYQFFLRTFFSPREKFLANLRKIQIFPTTDPDQNAELPIQEHKKNGTTPASQY